MTELQKRGLQLLANSPRIEKTEAARRLGCSRRSITNWTNDPEFVNRLRELQGTITAADIPSILEGLSEKARQELVSRLQEETGTRIEEIEGIESMVWIEGETPDFDAALHAVRELSTLLHRNDDSKEPNWKEELSQLERRLDARVPEWRDIGDRPTGDRVRLKESDYSGAGLFDDGEDENLVEWEGAEYENG